MSDLDLLKINFERFSSLPAELVAEAIQLEVNKNL